MVCLRNICINTLHKGGNDDDDNNNIKFDGAILPSESINSLQTEFPTVKQLAAG